MAKAVATASLEALGKPKKIVPTPIEIKSECPTIQDVFESMDNLAVSLKIPKAVGHILQWHPTGISVLDSALGGRGLPGGRFVEIAGPFQTGKTTLALECVRIAQASGGLGVYIDLEAGMSDDMARSLAGVSVDPRHWRLFRGPTAESNLNLIERSLLALGMLSPLPVVVVIDSVHAMIPESEFGVSYEDEAQMAGVSRLVTRFLRRNLLRLNNNPNLLFILINHMVGDSFKQTNSHIPEPPRSSGGKGMEYYPSIKIRLEKGESNTKGEGINKLVESRDVHMYIWKSRVSPIDRRVTVPFNLSTDAWGRPLGFDDGMGCMEFLKIHKVLTTTGGGWYRFAGLANTEPAKQLGGWTDYYRRDDGFRSMVQSLVKTTMATVWMVKPNDPLEIDGLRLAPAGPLPSIPSAPPAPPVFPAPTAPVFSIAVPCA